MLAFALAHSGANTRVSVPLYQPAVAVEAAAERITMMRLAVVAGPEAQVGLVAVEISPVNATFGERPVPVVCPLVEFH